MNENIDKFIDALSSSLRRETFVKLTLGNYKGTDEHLQKVQVRLIKTKKGTRLYFLYRSQTRDTAKNFSFEDGADVVRLRRLRLLGAVETFSALIFSRLKTTSN